MRLSAFILSTLFVGGLASAADVYKIDPDHAFVIFKASHLGFSNAYGRFTKMNGSFNLDEKDAAKSSVEFTIDADSVSTDVEKRDKHLRSPDFLDTKQFPKISFKSESVKKAGDKVYEIKGQLTLHGQTKPLTIKWNRMGTGKDPWGNERTGGETRFTVKRSDFGIKFMLDGISDEIEMVVSAEGIKGK